MKPVQIWKSIIISDKLSYIKVLARISTPQVLVHRERERERERKEGRSKGREGKGEL